MKTAAQVRQEFEESGIAISDWAAANNVSRYVVMDVLRGRTQNKRGKAHQVAVLLGMKRKPRNPLKKAT